MYRIKNGLPQVKRSKLFGEAGEQPVVISKSIDVCFPTCMGFHEAKELLTQWLVELVFDLKNTGVLIGHIKAYAQLPDSKGIWLSTTGNAVNVRSENGVNRVDSFVLHFTMIVFGADQKKVSQSLEQSLTKISTNTNNQHKI